MADFDDFDDFDFKPVTKGLGFHHGDKKESKKFNRTGALEKNIERRRKPLGDDLPINSISKDNLSSFYQTSQGPSSEPSITVSALNQDIPVREVHESASFYIRFVSWVSDLIVVISLLAVTLCGFFILLGVGFSQIDSMLTLSEFTIFGGVFFSVFYVAYFSVLDLNGSLGKMLFGLIVKSDEGNLSLNQTMIRSMITLFSFVLLFFPALIDLQGKITHTKVVRK
ncbi:MAG: RDD family protein [Bacteriovoracaceae bacterium]|nr:RDD family protein [Bacteriovoracaceae bacterium]